MKAPDQGREPLPLAAAAERLRGKPGRPRKAERAQPQKGNTSSSVPPMTRISETGVAGLHPRLLDLGTTARQWAHRMLAKRGGQALARHAPHILKMGRERLAARRAFDRGRAGSSTVFDVVQVNVR